MNLVLENLRAVAGPEVFLKGSHETLGTRSTAAAHLPVCTAEKCCANDKVVGR